MSRTVSTLSLTKIVKRGTPSQSMSEKNVFSGRRQYKWFLSCVAHLWTVWKLDNDHASHRRRRTTTCIRENGSSESPRWRQRKGRLARDRRKRKTKWPTERVEHAKITRVREFRRKYFLSFILSLLFWNRTQWGIN